MHSFDLSHRWRWIQKVLTYLIYSSCLAHTTQTEVCLMASWLTSLVQSMVWNHFYLKISGKPKIWISNDQQLSPTSTGHSRYQSILKTFFSFVTDAPDKHDSVLVLSRIVQPLRINLCDRLLNKSLWLARAFTVTIIAMNLVTLVRQTAFGLTRKKSFKFYPG
jgi:hypothetical protein